MDFGQLLHTAQKNEKQNKNEVRYYSTKFEPPKKEKKGKELSANIKKFLERKEAEEKRKAEEARKKKEELLALRAQDKKATRRVNVMLKRTKSANQSVIQDAVDNDNTAVTLAGPMQPDEDDYGYVSQEASAFYNKMMEKYSKMPEEPKFSLTKKKVSTNLSSTKDRVKAALEKEKEEAMQPHRRKRKHKDKDHKDNEEDEEGISFAAPDRDVRASSPEGTASAPPPPKPKPKAAPPPMNFAELLKIAEKKQFEPILIEKKEKDEERLLTKKQKKEVDREKESLQRREIRREAERRGMPPPPDKGPANNRIPKVSEKLAKPMSNDRNERSDKNDKIPKLNGQRPLKSPLDDRIPKSTSSYPSAKPSVSKPTSSTSVNNAPQRPASSNLDRNEKPISSSSKNSNAFPPRPTKNNLPSGSNVKINNRDQEIMRQNTSNINIVKDKPKSLSNSLNSKPKEFPPKDLKAKKYPPEDVPPRKYLPGDIRAKKVPPVSGEPKKFPPEDLKPKQFPPRDLKPKQFPPPDVRRKEFPSRDVKKPVIGSKRPILDDDSEYDSEMDDFIDDDEPESDYSKYISEIFGYDKSKYRDVDDDVDNMESTFAQQMKEEVISTKIGIMEDLEDMKKEEEEKRRKTLMKKKRKL